MALISSWLSMFRRRPDLIIAALKLDPGVRLADVGADRGYFTFRFAKAFGASGVVFAVEPDRRKAQLLARQGAQAFPTVDVVEPARCACRASSCSARRRTRLPDWVAQHGAGSRAPAAGYGYLRLPARSHPWASTH